jgi:hypothetical protein
MLIKIPADAHANIYVKTGYTDLFVREPKVSEGNPPKDGRIPIFIPSSTLGELRAATAKHPELKIGGIIRRRAWHFGRLYAGVPDRQGTCNLLPRQPRPIADNRVVVEKHVCEMSNLPAGVNEE